MVNLIDREALKKKYCDCCAVRPDCMGSGCKIYNARCLIEDLPTINAEPVRHGRWIETRYNPVGDTMYCDCNCSNCNFEITRERGRYPKFCENCGARMDLRTPTEVELDIVDSVMMGDVHNG